MNLTKKQTLGLLKLRALDPLEVVKALYDLAGSGNEEKVDEVMNYWVGLENEIEQEGGAMGIDENDDPIPVADWPERPPIFINPRPSHVS